MAISEKVGAILHGADNQARKEAARLMGSVRSDRKTEAARKTAAGRKGKPLSGDVRQRQAEGQRRRWEEYRRQRGIEPAATAEPRKRGRPAKPKPDQAEPVRPRGRPRKAKATMQIADGRETGD